MGLVREDGQPITCHYCGQDIDFADDEESWYHVVTGYYTCDDGTDHHGTPTCMWDPKLYVCNEPGTGPLKEEVRNRETDAIIEENYLAFLCKRHLKVAAYVAMPDHIVPFQLLDPFVIEETPG